MSSGIASSVTNVIYLVRSFPASSASLIPGDKDPIPSKSTVLTDNGKEPKPETIQKMKNNIPLKEIITLKY